MSERSSLDKALDANSNLLARNYWRSRMAGMETISYFGGNTIPRQTGERNFSTVSLTAPDHTFLRLLSIAATEEARHLLLLGVAGILAKKYSSSEEVCLFSPVSGAINAPGDPGRIIPFRIRVLPEMTFPVFLQSLKNDWIRDTGFSNYPLEKMINKEKQQLEEMAITGMVLQEIQATSALDTLQPEILFSFSTDKALAINIRYETAKFDPAYIAELADRYADLIGRLMDNTVTPVSEIPLLSAEERHRILTEFNDSDDREISERTMVDLFEEQVDRTPDKTAVLFESTQLTYRQLDERSNRLAHYLRGLGTKEDTLVGICMERGIGMIVGILAILKAGAGYVPVDPEYPRERIAYMLDDSGVKIVLGGNGFKEKIPVAAGRRIVEPDGDDSQQISQKPCTRLITGLAPHHLAYVIYTSGSTGRPKGVQIEHRNITRLFKPAKPVYDFNSHDVWTMFHSFCFDFSVWEMYGALFFGGLLIIVPANVTRDAVLFAALLKDKGVTILNQTPSAFYALMDHFMQTPGTSVLRYVIFGGEALSPARLRTWKQQYPDCRLINMYGITETTVHVTYKEIGWTDLNNSSVIGKPIPTLQVYILDDNRQIVPIGVTGELYVGGEGVARGYLNLPELTEQRFVADPFSTHPHAKLYRTGDLGRWRSDGDIVYIGRADDQVKIRGYRIELAEIARVAEECAAVRQAVIVVQEARPGPEQDGDGSGRRLVGYVVPEGPLDKKSILAHLRSRLPDYMVPVIWVPLSSLPLTANGKLDKRKLPEPELSGDKDYVPPSGDIEEKMVEIWSEVLQLDKQQISVTATFFELGGNSLKILQLTTLINTTLSMTLSIPDLFRYPSISLLVSYIREGQADPTINAGEMKDELLGMQAAIDILDQF